MAKVFEFRLLKIIERGGEPVLLLIEGVIIGDGDDIYAIIFQDLRGVRGESEIGAGLSVVGFRDDRTLEIGYYPVEIGTEEVGPGTGQRMRLGEGVIGITVLVHQGAHIAP